jgi:hypothetical protein
MACDKILNEICAELAEDIDSEVCTRLKVHLQECPHCAQQLQAMRITVHLFHCLDDKEVPVQIHERLTRLLNLPALPIGQ